MEKKKPLVIHSRDVMALVYEKALECYGVVGFARHDAEVRNNYEPLKEEELRNGIIVTKLPNGDFDVTLYVLLSINVKLTETLFELQKILRYHLNKKFENHSRKINVYALGVK